MQGCWTSLSCLPQDMVHGQKHHCAHSPTTSRITELLRLEKEL